MSHFRSIADIRRDYGDLTLAEDSLPTDPMIQFHFWFEEVLKYEKNDPTAMVVSTVDQEGRPDSRVVLLKGLEHNNFIFYTNYQSTKAIHIQHNPNVAVNFYWPEMARQVRIRGRIEKINSTQSDEYFSTRPIKSQFSALISPQSKEITSRVALEEALNATMAEYGKNTIRRPKHWGGYKISANEIEFWQGRDNRLHDRIHYYIKDGKWLHHRLAP